MGDSDSSFLTLISNKSRLDWGFSHESPPIRIDPRLSVSPNYKTQSPVGRRTSAHGQGLPDMSSLRISPANPLGASPKCPTDSGSPVTPVHIPRYRYFHYRFVYQHVLLMLSYVCFRSRRTREDTLRLSRAAIKGLMS